MGKHPTIELLERLNESLIYALESATCLAILYLAYYFLLRKEKSFRYNRFYLLAAVLFAVAFPLIEIDYNPATTPSVLNSIHQVGNEVGSEPIIEANKAYSYTITAQSERPFLLWWEIILALYIIGVALGIFKLLLRIRSFKEIVWFKRHNTRYKIKGSYFHVNTDGSMPTFSFFNYLFWDNTLDLTEREKTQILAHEKVHIREKHSYDIMFIEVLKIIFWFNPFLYLFKILLEECHEYLADRKVAAKTGSALYTQLLVKTVFRKMGLEYGSYFGKNQTVKRVNMLTSKKKVNFFKLLLPLPLIAILFFIFSFEAKIPSNVKIKNVTIENHLISGEDESPLPLEGIASLEESILYPQKAIAANIEGEVLVSFTVNTKGTIEDLKFDSKVGYDCEKEVLNALARTGKWKPAMIDGQPTEARVKLPIEFKRS
ncbi:TonB family protein [Roseivirga sp.]|uniref:TonB family protein n=1 Tax=Roseivirga sp. TaxID=1964215 RepID=UPI003B8E1D49